MVGFVAKLTLLSPLMDIALASPLMDIAVASLFMQENKECQLKLPTHWSLWTRAQQISLNKTNKLPQTDYFNQDNSPEVKKRMLELSQEENEEELSDYHSPKSGDI